MKTQSKQRIKQLLKQFPAIEKMHRLLDKDIKVRINVKTADHSLMYWYANNVLGNRHFLIGDKGQIGKRSELAFAVGENNEILKEMKWSQGSYQFIKNFADTVAPELIHQIIIVSRYDWYTEPTAAEKERDVEHGALCSRDLFHGASQTSSRLSVAHQYCERVFQCRIDREESFARFDTRRLAIPCGEHQARRSRTILRESCL